MSVYSKLAFLAGMVSLAGVSHAVAEEAKSSNPSLTAFGRLMFDYAYADGENTPFHVDDTEVRNARIGGKLKFSSGSVIKVELHTDESGDVILTDAYAELKTSKFPALRLGQFKTPNSLDEQTSSRFIVMHERSAFTDAFEFNRRVGAALNGSPGQVTYMIGVFADNIDAASTFGGFAIAGRGTYQKVIDEKDLSLHAGASFRYRDRDNGQPDFRYRQRPVTHIPGRIVSTGRIASSDFFVGGEAALIKGPFWAAGEYGVTFADCPACPDDP